jgi:hypothetical protein
VEILRQVAFPSAADSRRQSHTLVESGFQTGFCQKGRDMRTLGWRFKMFANHSTNAVVARLGAPRVNYMLALCLSRATEHVKGGAHAPGTPNVSPDPWWHDHGKTRLVPVLETSSTT